MIHIPPDPRGHALQLLLDVCGQKHGFIDGKPVIAALRTTLDLLPKSSAIVPNAVKATSNPKQQWATAVELAEMFDVPLEAARKRLARYRKRDKARNGWRSNEDRRRGEPQYFYVVSAVKAIMQKATDAFVPSQCL